MSKLIALVAVISACFAGPSPEAILSRLPYGDSMQIVVSDDLPPLPNGDWAAGHVDWGTSTITLSSRVLTPEWRHSFGPSTDRLPFLIAHEWAHVMQDRRWNSLGARIPRWVADPIPGNAPATLSYIYASSDPKVPWWELQADCAAQVLTGYSVMGYYVGPSGCTDVQLGSALSPLLDIGAVGAQP